MIIDLLKGSLLVQINFEKSDSDFDDNVCVCFEEPCHDDEKLFRAEQTHIYLTPSEARRIAAALQKAAEESDIASKDSI